MQQLASPAGISDQQLAINEVVPGGFVYLEQAVEFGSERHPVGEKTNPDGGIYQNHSGRRSCFARVLPAPRNVFRV